MLLESDARRTSPPSPASRDTSDCQGISRRMRRQRRYCPSVPLLPSRENSVFGIGPIPPEGGKHHWHQIPRVNMIAPVVRWRSRRESDMDLSHAPRTACCRCIISSGLCHDAPARLHHNLRLRDVASMAAGVGCPPGVGGEQRDSIANERGSVRPFEVPVAVAKPTPLPAPVTPSTNTATPPEVATEYVEAGKSLTLEVTANGSLPLFYEWRKDHQAIAGATNQRFTIQSVGDADAGIYVCVVRNSAGVTLSQPIKLVVRKPR